MYVELKCQKCGCWNRYAIYDGFADRYGHCYQCVVLSRQTSDGHQSPEGKMND